MAELQLRSAPHFTICTTCGHLRARKIWQNLHVMGLGDYCAEQFDNDESLISNIVKNIKRVMASEYSRDLSAKVHAGASRLARL